MEPLLRRPHVLVMSEITVDGKLTVRPGASSKILMAFMDPATERLLHTTRAECDAIMVGSQTILIDDSRLTVRLVEGNNPLRVVPASRGNIPAGANVLSDDARTLIAVSRAAPPENIEALRDQGAMVEEVGDDRVDLPRLMDLLWERYGVRRMMVEGGPTLNWHMLHHRLVDQIRLIHLPFIVGGARTPSLVGGMEISGPEAMIRLGLTRHYCCGTNLVTEYDVRYTDSG